MASTVLHNRAVIAVTGEEASAFLQSLVTCDVAGLEEGAAAYGGLLTPQGKILFDFFMLATAEGFLVDCAGARRDGLIQRLAMYKLRRAVDIAPRDDLVVAAGWAAQPARQGAFVDPRLEQAGWRAIVPADAADSFCDDDYEAHRIALGLADSDADIGCGEVFPHEANFDQICAVSFTKGCYIGQEVVSRMHHRGTARSRFVPLIASDGSPLAAGGEVMAGERRAGRLTSVSGQRALALVRLDRVGAAVAQGHGITACGHPVSIETPPWADFDIPGAGAA